MMRALVTLCLALMQLTLHAQAQALAQTDAASPQPSMDAQAERSRIAAERSRETARYESQERQCYARFAVSDCLTTNRLLRRTVMDDLRRQELALDGLERRNKALDQIERIRDKMATQAGQPAAP
jgi:colicin import membrane protein